MALVEFALPSTSLGWLTFLALLSSTTVLAEPEPDPRALFDLDEPATEAAPNPSVETIASAPARRTMKLTAAWWRDLPGSDLDHDALVPMVAGTSRDGGGPHLAGASSLEHRWLIDGAPSDDLRDGSRGTAIPLAFLDSIEIATGGFSARHRVATGAVIDATLLRPGDGPRFTADLRFAAQAEPTAIPVDSANLIAGVTRTPMASQVTLTAAAPLLGDNLLWYAAGVAPRMAARRLERTARRRVDRDQNGVADPAPGGVATETIDGLHRRAVDLALPFLFRVGSMRKGHEATLSLVGSFARATGFGVDGEASATTIDHSALDADLIAAWKGTWPGTAARVIWSWHRQSRTQTPTFARGAEVQRGTAYVPLPGQGNDGPVLDGCSDDPAVDPYPRITNCPIPTGFYASGGAGGLVDAIGDRPHLLAEVEQQLGRHRVAVGGTGEDARYRVRRRYSGGHIEQYLGPDIRVDTHLVEVGSGPAFSESCSDDGTITCRVLAVAETSYRTRALAGWITDTWRPGKTIAVDAGLRAESMRVTPELDQHALLPRLAVGWDVLGGGTARVFASWGRFAPQLPAGVAVLTAAGATERARLTSPLGQATDLRSGPALAVDHGLAPMIVDEALFGIELAAGDAVALSAVHQARWLRRGLDSVAGVLTNPTSGNAVDARRFHQAVELTAALSSSHLSLRAIYRLGAAHGNWAGLYDPRRGAVLYDSSDFDGELANNDGPLATTPRHRLLAELVWRRQLGAVEVVAGTRASLGSGQAWGALAFDDTTGRYSTQLLPRGSAGQSPPVTALSLHLAARWRWLEASLDLWNVMFRQRAAVVDEAYTRSSLRPIVDGTYEDLVFAVAEGGARPQLNPQWGRALLRQAPAAAVLSLRAWY